MALNKQQKEAVEKTSGSCVILAGAGTGKSFTVVEKIHHLVSGKLYAPEEILCLTFSNEATNSLRIKVQERLGGVSQVTVKTFHSFCADILREDGHLVGVDEGFEILLPDDAKILVHKYLGASPYWSNRYVSTISTAKDFGISSEDIKAYFSRLANRLCESCPLEGLEERAREVKLELQTLHLEPQNTKEEKAAVKAVKSQGNEFLSLYGEYKRFKDFTDVWDAYDGLKRERKLLDFADLNRFVQLLFSQYGSEKYVKRYKYVFVDEFQDTNKLQFDLIEHIAAHHNITVVGDPNQSVYGFRGAYRESFNHFKKVFGVDEKKDVFKLEKSYRSPNKVLKIAYELIKNNYENQNECFLIQNADGIEGDKVKVVELVKAEEEARYIADTVEKAIGAGTSMSEICVLHRTHKQSGLIRRALELKKIPVISAGRTNLLQRREIKTAIGYLSVLSNLYSRSGTGEQAWWDMFHYHNTLSPSDSLIIGRYLKKHRDEKISIDEALLTGSEELPLSPEGKKTVKRVASRLKELVEASNRALPDLILDIYELSGLNRAFTHERTVENVESMLNLKRFHELAAGYYELHGKTIPEFIDYLEIIDALGVDVEAARIQQIDAVRLMTIHAVKGLEYELVIVSNMAEDRFPVSRTRNEPLIPKELLPDLKAAIASWGDIPQEEKEKRIKEYEQTVLLYEERRLCYVAWTRAKKNLLLTYARSYGSEPDSNKESIFLEEIDHRKNPNVEFIEDKDELSAVIAPDSSHERHKALLKEQIMKSLDTDPLSTVIERVIRYSVCRDKKAVDYKAAFKDVDVSAEEMRQHLLRSEENSSCLKFNPLELTFSPSSLGDYDNCPKMFELKNLYQMPQRGDFDDEGTGATTGSFIHEVLEEGVKEGFKSLEEYLKHADKKFLEPDWKGVDEKDTHDLITVFWARNKDKITSKSKTELPLSVEMDGFRFYGIADRVDTLPDGTVEIVDYKTNGSAISPKKRAWQLGFYALALEKLGYKVSKLTLDMLRLEKPVEMTLDAQGNAVSGGRDRGFNLNEVKEELLTACRSIANDFEHEFTPTDDENNCRWCGLKFYCPKWEEK